MPAFLTSSYKPIYNSSAGFDKYVTRARAENSESSSTRLLQPQSENVYDVITVALGCKHRRISSVVN